MPRAGACQPVAPLSASCSPTPPYLLCATGITCDLATSRCVASSGAALGVGEACVDSGFNLLGDCVDSWCDLFDTRRCEPLQTDGASCGNSYWYPVEWSWIYPTSVNDSPTAPRTFYLVLDQIDGDDAVTFALEWAITT